MILPALLARFRREIKLFLLLAIVPAAHGILLALFSVLTQDRGFVTPSGSVDLGFLAFGLLVLATRVAALVVVPLVAVYLVVRRLLGPASQDTAPPASQAPSMPHAGNA